MIIAKRLIAALLLLSLTGFSAASLFSLHLHVLPSGRVVVHSHPLPDDNDERSHNHSQQEYVALEAATRILEAGAFTPTDGPPINSDLRGIFYIDDELSLLIAPHSLVAKRAPPLLPLS